ncbi:MAG: tetratricopeptide repeat protein [Pseudomonadota bacterium]
MRLYVLLSLLLLIGGCNSNNDFESDLNQTKQYVATGEYQKAESLYKKMIKKYSDDAKVAAVYFLLGEFQENSLTNVDDAKKSYESVIEKYGDTKLSKRARINLAHIAKDEEDWEGAIYQYEELIRNNPDEPIFRVKLAESYIASENFEQARIELGPILNNQMKLKPDVAARALFVYAESFFMGKRYEEAREQYQAIIRKFVDSEMTGETMIKIATCYEIEGYNDEAINWLKKAKPFFQNKAFIDKRLAGLKKRGK